MKQHKIGTVAIVVAAEKDTLTLVETISDDHEIAAFENALEAGVGNPLESVYALRVKQAKEDEDFGIYVENLLSQPFVRTEIQEHGVAWLKSKIRIEEYQKCETDAAKVIAGFAFTRFQQEPELKEFLLVGPVAKVKVRIFRVSSASIQIQNAA